MGLDGHTEAHKVFFPVGHFAAGRTAMEGATSESRIGGG